MATDIVLASELSDQFDVGVLEANKIRLKFDAITTALTPKTWAGATINDAVASAEATTCNAMELSDGTYMATGRVSWAAHGLTVGSYGLHLGSDLSLKRRLPRCAGERALNAIKSAIHTAHKAVRLAKAGVRSG